MQNLHLTRTISAVQLSGGGKPTLPFGKQPIVERKVADPSSTPTVEKYPVPSFYERRIKARDYDPL